MSLGDDFRGAVPEYSDAIEAIRARGELEPYESIAEYGSTYTELSEAPPHGSHVSVGGVVIGTVVCAYAYCWLTCQKSRTVMLELVGRLYESARVAPRTNSVMAFTLTGFTGFNITRAIMMASLPGGLYPVPKVSKDRFWGLGFLFPETTVIGVSEVTNEVQDGGQGLGPNLNFTRILNSMNSRRLNPSGRWQRLPTAVALAKKSPPFATVGTMWEAGLSPLTPFNGFDGPLEGTFIRDAGQWPDLDSIASEIGAWLDRLTGADVSRIEIGLRQLERCLAVRQSPTEKLIDSVIAWESWFGSATETSFKVTASIAKLLEEPGSGRVALQKKLAKVYGQRSRMIHGGASPSYEEILEDSDFACQIAISVLAELLMSPDKWLVMGSEERCKEVLLNVP